MRERWVFSLASNFTNLYTCMMKVKSTLFFLPFRSKSKYVPTYQFTDALFLYLNTSFTFFIIFPTGNFIQDPWLTLNLHSIIPVQKSLFSFYFSIYNISLLPFSFYPSIYNFLLLPFSQFQWNIISTDSISEFLEIMITIRTRNSIFLRCNVTRGDATVFFKFLETIMVMVTSKVIFERFLIK